MQQEKQKLSLAELFVTVVSFVAINIVYERVSGDPFRDGKLIFFIFAFLSYASILIGKRFGGFIGAAMFLASAEWSWQNGTFFGIVPIFGTIGFLALGHYFSKASNLLLLILRASTHVQLFYCGMQIFGHQGFLGTDHRFDGAMLGTFGHPIATGAWMAAVAPLAYFYWSRAEFLMVCFVCLYAGSTMGILALLAGGLYVWWRRIGWPVLAISLVMAVLLLLGVKLFSNVEFFSLSGRMLPWSRAVFWLKESPWIGYGPGSWAGLYPRWGVEYFQDWIPMHSDALQLAFEVGIPGFLLFVTGMWMVLRSCSIPFGAVVVALLANGLGSFPFHIPELAFLFCAALAVGHNGKDGLSGKVSGS